MKRKPFSAVAAGGVVAAAAVVLFFTYFYTGLSFETNFLSYIPSFVTMALLIFFVIQYSNAMNHDVTFGNLFGYGFRATSIFALIMVAFMFGVNYLLPVYKEMFMEEMTNKMMSDTKLTDQQRELGIATTKKFFLIGMVGGGMFINLIIGTIGSLIGATFARKKPTTPFENQA